MEFLPQFLIDWFGQSKYILMFFGTIIEGPVVMLAAGFLYHLGQLSLVPMYLVLLAGDITGDIIWYSVGRYGARTIVRKYGKFFNITPEVIERIEGRFKKYQTHILIISKLTMGFGFALATLVVAGMLKVSFRKYIAINLIGGVIWTAFMIWMGYLFGNVYTLLDQQFKVGFVIIVTVAVIIGLRSLNRYFINRKNII